MAKRRGNPNWGKPEPIGPITPTITEFEQVVREYKLSPDQYLRSTRLREWARRNKNSKYIPNRFWKPGDSKSNPRCNRFGPIRHRGRLTGGLFLVRHKKLKTYFVTLSGVVASLREAAT